MTFYITGIKQNMVLFFCLELVVFTFKISLLSKAKVVSVISQEITPTMIIHCDYTNCCLSGYDNGFFSGLDFTSTFVVSHCLAFLSCSLFSSLFLFRAEFCIYCTTLMRMY